MKRMLLAVLLFLTGCNSGGQRYDSLEMLTPVKLSKAQMAAVRSGVTKSLKDPESARFGAMIGGKSSKGTITVCGYVNAKNSFGGYTGEKPFTGVLVSHDKKFVMVGMGGSDIDTQVTMDVCRKQGLDL
jgi:hypothetical protein